MNVYNVMVFSGGHAKAEYTSVFSSFAIYVDLYLLLCLLLFI